MIQVLCHCGFEWQTSEKAVNRTLKCRQCWRETICLSGEALAEGAGSADFDRALTLVAGPESAGQQRLLGGCAAIEIGKLPTKPLCLSDTLVSRNHCRLERVDFGPSRWAIQDTQSTNGVFVNGQKITRHELQPGDRLQIGPYHFAYDVAGALPPAAQALETTPGQTLPAQTLSEADLYSADAAPDGLIFLDDGAAHSMSASPGAPVPGGVGIGGRQCPSCRQPVAYNAAICVPCGIRVNSGRPLLIAKAMDVEALRERARQIIYPVSFVVPVMPLPLPVASEAYGRYRPWAIWAIIAVTTLFSVLFAVANVYDPQTPMRAMQLYPPLVDLPTAQLRLEEKLRQSYGMDGQTARATATNLIEHHGGEFEWFQLLTHALLHDPGLPMGLLLHLGGNMIFLWVFGSRVNAIIGNLATAAIYPVLAVGSAVVYLLTLPADHFGALLGASGAINGLAGMYLILFPAHQVYCAMWVRVSYWTGIKVFALRGFWVLLIYLLIDTLSVAFGRQDGTAHWAHLGGFVTGVAIAIGLLASRQFDCRNGDLLSIILGKHAWPIVGRPSERQMSLESRAAAILAGR